MKLLERRRNLIGAFARFIRTVFGIPPITLEACVNDKSTIDYKLYGESVQDGTPTPDAPVEVESVGVRTKNLLNLEKIIGTNITIKDGVITQIDVTKSARIDIPVSTLGTYTISFNSNKSRDFWVRNGRVSNGYITNIGKNDTAKTFVVSNLVDGYIRLDCFGATGQEPFILSNIQLELSNTATDYEPCGYKIPVVTSGKNLWHVSNAITNSKLTYDENTQTFTIATSGILTSIHTFDIPIPAGSHISLTLKVLEGSMAKGYLQVGGYHFGDKNSWQGYVKTLEINTELTDKVYVGENLNTTDTITDLVVYIDGSFSVTTPIKFQVQLEFGEPTNYEPYQEPITTNIYLDEPLRKIGDYADYIDFENQVVVRNVKRVDLRNAPGGTYSWLGKKGVTFGNLLDKNYSRNQNAFCNREYYFTASGAEKSTIWVGVGSKIIYWVGILDALELASTEEFNEWLTNNATYLLYGSDLPTETPIELPQLPTFKGTTIYSVDTNIQPSNMEVTYYSKERSVS